LRQHLSAQSVISCHFAENAIVGTDTQDWRIRRFGCSFNLYSTIEYPPMIEYEYLSAVAARALPP